ncbi:MAG: amidase [Euzebya sp.]
MDSIAAGDKIVNSVAHVDAAGALASAKKIDQQVVSDPDSLPAYAGVPMLIKDLNNVSGMPTTFGTASMSQFVPPFDDETVRRIRAAGFVILGKTNAPEIGTLPVTESALLGPARNPWNPAHTPGGSSGGAAAAVAAGYLPAAHGSDGSGSIRIPASCCGVVGIKPGRGRVSQAPLFGDQVMGYSTQGSLGRRVVDAAALLDVMQGYAPGDPYHLPPPLRPYAEEAGADPGPCRIGLVSQTPWALPNDDVQAALAIAVETLEGLGHSVEPLHLPLPAELISNFLTIWSASVASNPLPIEQLEPHNRAFAEHGHRLSAPDLLRAFTSLQMTSRAVVTACLKVDAVLAPVLMTPPVPIGHFGGDAFDADDSDAFDGLVEDLGRYLGLTPIINVTGQPAVGVPIYQTAVSPGTGTGLPIGVQLIGGAASEAPLIRLAAQLESVCRWDLLRPQLRESAKS